MNKNVVKIQSNELKQEMTTIVYGDTGYPVVVFPTQDSPCTNFEDFGMVDELSDYLEAGSIQLFCVESIDARTWSDAAGDKEERAALEEAYYRYICDELVPLVHERTGSDLRPLAMGCSMGATHAAIFALRRPDLFQGCVALSGVYDAQFFFGNWMDKTLYDNDPCAFLPNMPEKHPYVQLYNKRQLVFCVGQGAWEEDGVRTQRVLDEEFERLGVSAWCDYWGFDVNHDWPWWKKQVRYFLPIVLNDIKKSLDAEGFLGDKPVGAEAADEPKKPAASRRAARKKAAPEPAEGREPAEVVVAEKPAVAVAEPVAAAAEPVVAAEPVKASAAKTAAAESTSAAKATKKKPAAKSAAKKKSPRKKASK